MAQRLTQAQRYALYRAIEARKDEFKVGRWTYERIGKALQEGLGFPVSRRQAEGAVAATGVEIEVAGPRRYVADGRDVLEAVCRWAKDLSLMSGVPLPAIALAFLERRDKAKGTRPPQEG